MCGADRDQPLVAAVTGGCIVCRGTCRQCVLPAVASCGCVHPAINAEFARADPTALSRQFLALPGRLEIIRLAKKSVPANSTFIRTRNARARAEIAR